MSASSPFLLALDTATERVHVALVHGQAVHCADLAGGAQASSTLLPALRALLAEVGGQWADVQAIAFGAGPGAFTGLRTACSVAQGLALGLSCPVIALDTLMVVAEDARLRAPEAWTPGDVLWVLQDARMGELYVGAFVWTGQAWAVHVPAALWPQAEPGRRWAAPADRQGLRLAGNALVNCAEALSTLLAPEAEVWQDAAAVPSGLGLAELAKRAWAQGDTQDAALALPRYVRDKVAQTTAERAADKQAHLGGA